MNLRRLFSLAVPASFLLAAVMLLPAQLRAAPARSILAELNGSTSVPLGWLAQTLVPDHPGSIDQFGYSVAVDGARALIGAPLYPQNQGGNGGQGAVYAYEYSGGQWTLTQTLSASDASPGGGFGSAITLVGDTAVIAAPTQAVGAFLLQGAAYVFHYADGEWTEVQKLVKTDGTALDNYFAESVAFNGQRIVLGQSGVRGANGETNVGAAFVFEPVGGVWTQTAVLGASDPEENDSFGRSLAFAGDTLFISAPESHWSESGPGPGAVYRFEESGGGWTEAQIIAADDPEAGAYFGQVISGDGTRVVFGSPGATIDGLAYAGAVYVFESTGGDWTQQRKISAEDAGGLAVFGRAIQLRGSLLAVGAAGAEVDGTEYAGAAYLMSADDGSQLQKFTAADPLSGDYAGWSVALQLTPLQLLTGAPHAIDDGSGDPGKAFAFTDDVVFASGFDSP